MRFLLMEEKIVFSIMTEKHRRPFQFVRKDSGQGLIVFHNNFKIILKPKKFFNSKIDILVKNCKFTQKTRNLGIKKSTIRTKMEILAKKYFFYINPNLVLQAGLDSLAPKSLKKAIKCKVINKSEKMLMHFLSDNYQYFFLPHQ